MILGIDKNRQKTPEGDHRPWGFFRVLAEGNGYKVKSIKVAPGQRLSLQKHRRRREHWVVVSGEALVTREGEDISLGVGQSVDIPLEAAHRVFNPGKDSLVIIEVQIGEYLGEDDIVRLEDDYGRLEDSRGGDIGDEEY